MAKINMNINTRRIRTGLYSFDWALRDKVKNECGLPLDQVIELYGKSQVGKSTFAIYLSNVLGHGNPDSIISIVDLEGGMSKDYLERLYRHFDGTVNVLPLSDKNGERVPHETLVEQLADSLRGDTVATILDSVSTYAPIGEAVGSIGERFMGQRAFQMAQYSRRSLDNMSRSENPSAALVINHEYQKFGMGGHNTAGGVLLGVVAGVRIRMWKRVEDRLIKDDNNPTEDVLVSGTVMKLRRGSGARRGFRLGYVEGWGVHRGITALHDARGADLLAFPRGVVKIEGKSHGKRLDFLAHAKNGETGSEARWQPFYELLEKHEKEVILKDV